MSDQVAVAGRFVGQRVARKEDRRLLTGRGQYTDDVVTPGMLEAAFVRSPVARGRIASIDVEAARALPGVRAVFTAAELRRLPSKIFHNFTSPDTPMPDIPPIAEDRVCFAGDPVALVIAENRYIAEDAAGLVDVQYEFEDPVITCEQAANGPPVHPKLGTNLAHSERRDDPEIEAIFAKAAHVVTGTINHQRQTHVPMETRGVVSHPEGVGELTVHLSCQSPHQAARYIAKVFELPDHHVRVVAKDVGGGFGLKVQVGREEIAVIAASLILGRPVKWIEDRLENLTASHHAREQSITVKFALDADGRILAADVDYENNIGAYPQVVGSGGMAMMIFTGPYRIPKYSYRARAYYSNTCGQGAYRGPWMIESLARETMMDIAARQIGMDPVEFRLRNLISKADQPFTTPMGLVLDRVTPRETLDLAMRKVDVAAFRKEQEAARAAGRYLGLGFAVYVEPTTMAFGGTLASEVAHVRVEPTGKVVATMSTHSQGHGTQTTMAQVIADQLGVDIADVTVLEGDSSRSGFGAGAGGSRQAVAGGGAALVAADQVKSKIKKIAAYVMNAAPEDVEIERGVVAVRGVAETVTTVQQIAEIAYFQPDRLPPDTEPGLECQYRYKPPPIVFSNATHACIVEVDVDTGMVRILRWIASEDCGVMINPAVVEGQIAGGVLQGIGGVLYEHASYDASGNPTAVTFKDYIIPSAHEAPVIEYCHLTTPSESHGGFKGVGEGGAIIAPPTLVNAIADALSPFGVRCLDLPLSPDRIVRLLEGARPPE